MTPMNATTTTASYDEVHELVFAAVARHRLPAPPDAPQPMLSVEAFIAAAQQEMVSLMRWSDEAEDITGTVMLWEEFIARVSPNLLGRTAVLVELAAEISLVRGRFFDLDVNTELSFMCDDDLTSGDPELDKLLIMYGEMRK